VRKVLVAFLACQAWLFAPAFTATAVVEADRDATLIEDPAGELANGSGPFFFVGRTSQEAGSIRRGLLRFDVAGAIPRRAIVEDVALVLYLRPSNPGGPVRLHRVQADWGEGPSAASGGGGRPALPGDATWIHTVYDRSLWVRAGGQFIGRASAVRRVDGSGLRTWDSNPHLVQDVRLWLRAPSRNFGWILIGDEGRSTTAQAFASREHPDPALRPRLLVTYRLPGR
jgi:hypothetical protein